MRIVLTSYRETLAPAFVDCCADPAAFAFLRKSFPDAATPSALFERFLISRSSPPPHTHVWAIVMNDGTFAGHVELKATDKTVPGEGELVALVTREVRRTGVASAALALLLRSPHLAPEFRSLLAVCRPNNEASLRVVRRSGFVSLPDRSSAEALFFGYERNDRTTRLTNRGAAP
jgi:RimJ/RimL family protein N-acetyltransferase